MFGGAGISLDGVTFALFFGDTLYLKSDTETRTAFDAEGLEPFAYARRDRRVVTSYHRAPDAVFDDPDAMRQWSGMALAAARRVEPKSGRKGGRGETA